MRASGFLLPNIALDCTQLFPPYLRSIVDRSYIYRSTTPEPMLYWPDHLSMFRNYVPIRIDMQVLSNRRTKLNRATPKLRDFAERLISVEVSKSSASKPPAVITVLDKLRPCLAQVVGELGFRAVLLRALAKANADVAWLRAVHVKADGSLEGLDELEAKLDPKQIAEGRVVLLAEFFGLLVELIGEPLVLRLVHTAMPNVPKDDLYFGKGGST